METRNLRVWRDNIYPRYLQILPAQVEVAQMHDYNHNGEIIKTHVARRSVSGLIDMVTTPDQPVLVGDTFRTPVSVIEITEIQQRRPAKGDYAVPGVEWLRCAFTIKQRT